MKIVEFKSIRSIMNELTCSTAITTSTNGTNGARLAESCVNPKLFEVISTKLDVLKIFFLLIVGNWRLPFGSYCNDRDVFDHKDKLR